ncbi:hypothetical protein AB1E19_015701 [Capra hircus]
MSTGPRTAERVVWHSLSITFSSSSLPTQIHVIQELVTFWCRGESQEPARKSRRVGDFGGPGSPAPRAGQRQPPGREELRPALQHGGGGGGGGGGRAAVSPALAAVTGAAAPPRLRVRRDPRRGRHAALRASEPGVFRTDLPRPPREKGPSGVGKSRGRRGAGALQGSGSSPGFRNPRQTPGGFVQKTPPPSRSAGATVRGSRASSAEPGRRGRIRVLELQANSSGRGTARRHLRHLRKIDQRDPAEQDISGHHRGPEESP